ATEQQQALSQNFSISGSSARRRGADGGSGSGLLEEISPRRVYRPLLRIPNFARNNSWIGAFVWRIRYTKRSLPMTRFFPIALVAALLLSTTVLAQGGGAGGAGGSASGGAGAGSAAGASGSNSGAFTNSTTNPGGTTGSGTNPAGMDANQDSRSANDPNRPN